MKITGYVFDSETKNGIIGANIIITKDVQFNDLFQTGAATGLDGQFVTSRLPIGKYKVTFRNMGYKEKVEYVDISKTSGALELNVFLTSSKS